ncbi:primase-helicase zinc-binding domain-containing protein [Cupriavidus basilensis]|uniref:Primase-helicase zinc-binding domain-containing protein n=1 Tax=Cupriavidus basilensis TaxID=68895 RepID=A0ABT6AKZ3_9BURK|nr:primase-helicase zinc-binding domain-containing protein [Cupriavidus basilensis]MDF3833279.1 primase-helicase zinc-binding domain-containing protein [Cupriavidus basilensis]
MKCLSKRQGPCPLCGGKTRFRFDNRNDAGTYFCNHCGAGNGYTLLRAFAGMTDREALEFLEGESGCRPAAHYDERSLKAKAEAEAREKRAKLNAA